MLSNGLVKNSNHKAFKTPLHNYDKCESSQADKKNHSAKIHYNYATNDNVTNMVKPVERVFMMRPQREEEAKPNVPKIMLQMLYDLSPLSETLNDMTRGQAKVVLCMDQDPKPNLPSKSTGPLAMCSYDLVHQLQKTPAQISIFELLELSPLHKEILEKALRVASVPPNLDPNKL